MSIVTRCPMTTSNVAFAFPVICLLAGGLAACTQDLVDDTSQDLAIDEASRVTHGRSAGLRVTYTGSVLPADIAGHYYEAFDCTQDEGGPFFGNVDPAHCFRKSDRSAWRVWNTGCGWEYGFVAPFPFPLPFPPMWQRFARTYSGLCAEIPDQQLDTRALTTSTFFDDFGAPISGLTSSYRTPHRHQADSSGL